MAAVQPQDAAGGKPTWEPGLAARKAAAVSVTSAVYARASAEPACRPEEALRVLQHSTNMQTQVQSIRPATRSY